MVGTPAEHGGLRQQAQHRFRSNREHQIILLPLSKRAMDYYEQAMHMKWAKACSNTSPPWSGVRQSQ